MKLTQEEKAIVAHYLNSDPTIWGATKEYWPLLTPILCIELYGLYTYDTTASAMGFVALLGFIFWFFKQGGKSGLLLKNALKKYEAEVSAIDSQPNT